MTAHQLLERAENACDLMMTLELYFVRQAPGGLDLRSAFGFWTLEYKESVWMDCRPAGSFYGGFLHSEREEVGISRTIGPGVVKTPQSGAMVG